MNNNGHRKALQENPVLLAEVESIGVAESPLDAIKTFVRRFVFLSELQARVASAWIVHTHAIEAADSTPYLAITSAEKQCGKSRFLEALELLVAEPWKTDRATVAVLPRKIHKLQPTLLLDESDAAFKGAEEYAETLRGILNSGHRRGGKTTCCTGPPHDITFQDFNTFCPKAIAGIGKLPDTVADRSVPIRLKRAARGERVERFRRRDVEPEAALLKARIEEWVKVILPGLRDARPELPEELSDREQDGAEPLLAIADKAGGDWPTTLRLALVVLCKDVQDASIGVQLLSDIRQVFDGRELERISSADLASTLCEIETSPWAEWHGKALSVGKLARLLGPFEVRPASIRIGEKTPKGYSRQDFQDAWERYLPASMPVEAPKNATTQQPFTSNAIEQKQNATKLPVALSQMQHDLPVADWKAQQSRHVADCNVQKPCPDAACDVVALFGHPTGTDESLSLWPDPDPSEGEGDL